MIEEVQAILGAMRGTDQYDSLESSEQTKAIGTAEQLLKIHYGNRTKPVAVAFQVLYTLEAEREHIDHLKRHGAQSFGTKGTTISFKEDSSYISPDVVAVMGVPTKGAGTGRLI